MIRNARNWYARTVSPILARRNALAYDMTYWRSRTFTKEILKSVMGIVCICAGGFASAIIIVHSAQNALWLAYVCIGCITVFCLWGILPLTYGLWLIAKALKERGRPKKVRH